MLKCCKCERKLKGDCPGKDWTGLYTFCTLIKAICSECEKKPENELWYRTESSD